MKKSIVVAGSLAQKPGKGGHTWVLLQYLLGFRRLGWDVLFLDQLEPEMCTDEDGQHCPVEQSFNLRYFLEVMQSFDFHGAFALICNRGEKFIGLSRQRVLERTRNSAFLLNVMGFLTDEEIVNCAPERVFLDIDPGFGQMWQELGLRRMFDGYDHHVTIGENIGQPGCTIPSCGLEWIPMRQPVVLDFWPPCTEVSSKWFTSVATWRGAFGPLEYQGKTYGLRVHEFRRFAQLPRISGQPFQLALDIHAEEVKDLALLADNGWCLVDPKVVAGNPRVYQSYIQGSKAEFMVAKNMYVEVASGWFSDRSICYLATGKPVLAQDTGLRDLYPTGKGLLIFNQLDEALSGVEELLRDLPGHARAARAIAEEYFDSDKVLSRLLDRIGVT